MNQFEKIKSLEREIELLKQIVELKDKLLAAPNTIHYYTIPPNPVNPSTIRLYGPYDPLYPTITCGETSGNEFGISSATSFLNS